MTETNTHPADSAQEASCDTLQHLARALEDAEFRDGEPGLQDDNWHLCSHPALKAYANAVLMDAHREPIPEISLADAEAAARRAAGEYAWRCDRARGGGLRRLIDAWGRNETAQRNLNTIRKKTAGEYVKREGDKSRPIVNGVVHTGRTVLIDGVRVPVIEIVS
jgi:hypothetical protein